MSRIIDELKGVAGLDWNPQQKAYYEQRARDARDVECVPMKEVFTPEQMKTLGKFYHARMKMCYKNAATLVSWIKYMFGDSFKDKEVRYVEGFAYSCGLLPIEHAFVRVGDKYIDPTFERVLKKNVRKEEYVSLIELTVEEMNRMQVETGCYGELYLYDYMCKNSSELAERMRRCKDRPRRTEGRLSRYRKGR